MDILIPDISEYQELIDHQALVDGLRQAYGFACVIARLNYGNTAVDAEADRNIDGLRRAGADAIGFYTYLIATQEPAAQAAVLVRVLLAHGGLRHNEFVVCDDEEGSGDQSARVDAFLAAVDVGLKVADPAGEDWWYSGLNFSIAHNLPSARGHRWIAAYGAGEPGAAHDLWQFTDAQQFPGIAAPCDASVFHGSGADFLALIGGTMATDPTIAHIDETVDHVYDELRYGTVQGDPSWFLSTLLNQLSGDEQALAASLQQTNANILAALGAVGDLKTAVAAIPGGPDNAAMAQAIARIETALRGA